MGTDQLPIHTRFKAFGLEFLSGLFFLVSILLMLYFTAVINGKDWLAEKTKSHYTIQFAEIGQLAPNNEVCIRGMRIGKVGVIKMSDDFKYVAVSITTDLPLPLRQDYVINIRNSSVFGGHYIEIDPGCAANPAPAILTGAKPIDLIKDASDLLVTIREDEKVFRAKVIDSPLFGNIANAAEKLANAAHSVQSLSTQMQSGNGTLSLLLQDSTLYLDAGRAIAHLNASGTEFTALLKDIRSGKGSLSQFIYSDSVASQINSTMKSFTTSADRVNQAAGRFDQLLRDLANPDNSTGKLLFDRGKLYDSAQQSLNDLRSFTKSVTDQNGTLGRLINNDDLYRHMMETSRKLQITAEKFSEPSPIKAFGSMIFGTL